MPRIELAREAVLKVLKLDPAVHALKPSTRLDVEVALMRMVELAINGLIEPDNRWKYDGQLNDHAESALNHVDRAGAEVFARARVRTADLLRSLGDLVEGVQERGPLSNGVQQHGLVDDGSGDPSLPPRPRIGRPPGSKNKPKVEQGV